MLPSNCLIVSINARGKLAIQLVIVNKDKQSMN